MLTTLKYDRAEHRTKHCWQHPHAGDEPKDGGRHLVGKCSSRITDEVAETLLNSGIRVDAEFNELLKDDGFPDAVYAVFEHSSSRSG